MADTKDNVCTVQAPGEKPDGVVETVKDMIQGAAANTAEFASKAKDAAQEWGSSAARATGRSRDKVHEVTSAAVENAIGVGQRLTTLIRRYPLQAVLVGLGAGFLAAQMLRRARLAKSGACEQELASLAN